jgi:glyoxylase-like metal-dependent hydrolase (beta-lactamase superfamily II)
VNCLKVGAASVERIAESEEPILDPLQLFPDASAQDLAAQMSWLAPRFYDPASGLLPTPIQGFVVRAGGRIIVVDTCVGDCKERKRPLFHRQRRDWLGRLGVRPEAVDFVVCTHFHVDHVGWNTRLEDGRWVPSFPRARYLFVREEWDYWRSAEGLRAMERAGDYMADSVLPVVEAGVADFVAMDHAITPEVQLVPAAGHTPGCVCIDIRSHGARLVLAGDLMHTPLQCAYPEWSTRFCTEPARAARTRIRLLSEWSDGRTIVVPTHFPAPSAVTLERRNGAFAFRFLQ